MNRKLEWKRLLLYLALSFGLTWIIFFAFILTGHKWDGSNPTLESFTALGMLMPFLAHVLTRKITKEGFRVTGKDSMMLGIELKNKKWKYYVFAMLIPWLYFEVWHALALLLSPEMFDPEYYKVYGIEKNLVWLMPLNGIISGTIISFAALGEEGGWRGYMMPKLISLVGMKKAVLIGGIIWGLWHAPLTCVGHNFGTDYPGFPFLGIFIMCVDCVLTGILFTFVMVKSGSVWPAAIMHGVNNANPSLLTFFMNTEKGAGILSNSFSGYFLYFIPTAIIAAFCLKSLCQSAPSGETTESA
ncbi:MAG: CPBP family intramembrane glutamic endopeptidase [Lachnospiraceae bacterium]